MKRKRSKPRMTDQKKPPTLSEADQAEIALGAQKPADVGEAQRSAAPAPQPASSPPRSQPQPDAPAAAPTPPQKRPKVPYKDLPRDRQIRELLLGGSIPRMIEHAIPKGVDLDPIQFLWTAITTIEKPNPKTGERDIYRCSDLSILQAIFQAAELGLEFGGAQADCWLINYRNEATFQMAAYGYLTLAYRCGIVRVLTDVIYQADKHAIVRGLEPNLIHDVTNSAHLPHDNVDYDHQHFVPLADGGRGVPLFAYVVAEDREGRKHWDFITEDTAQRARNTSRSPDSNAYKIWPDEMRKRTAITRARKVWPRAKLMGQAILSDERGEISPLVQKMLDEVRGTVTVQAEGSPVPATAQARGLDSVMRRLEQPRQQSARSWIDQSDNFLDTTELVASKPVEEEKPQQGNQS